MRSRRCPELDVVLLHDPELLPAAAGPDSDVHEDTSAGLTMKLWLPGYARPPASIVVRAVERRVERRVSLTVADVAYYDRLAVAHPVIHNSIQIGHYQRRRRWSVVVYIGRMAEPRGAPN